MENIEKISRISQFQEAIKKELAIVYFSADWCAPCRKFKPIFLEVAQAHPEKIFYLVDVERAEEIVTEVKITSIPTVWLYKKGLFLAKLENYSKEGLEELLKIS